MWGGPLVYRAEAVTLQRRPAEGTSKRNQLAGRAAALDPEGPMIRAAVDGGFSPAAFITRPAREELELHPGNAIVALIKATAVQLR